MAKTVKEVRRDNLRHLVDTQYGGVMRRLAVAMHVQHIQLSRVFSRSEKSRRDIGDDLARKIEEVAGLPVGWMDHPHGGDADRIFEKLIRLDDRDQDAVEALIDSMLGDQ